LTALANNPSPNFWTKKLGALTEVEIFGCLGDNLRRAAEDCRLLAWHPSRGRIYDRFRASLKLVEGACRQAYYWRDYDARWLYLGKTMHEAHERAGNWIRGPIITGPEGESVYTGGSKDARKVAHPKFQKLAEELEHIHKLTERVRVMATFHSGPILPAPEPGPHRDTRPVQVMTPGGILLPPSWREQGLRRRAAT
jgi:hypothetical protein